MRLVLNSPDIPQNTGTILRMAACLGVPVDLVFPLGFLWSDSRLRRAGLDYLPQASLTRHDSWAAFVRDRPPGRLVLLTTAGAPYTDFSFNGQDQLVVGSESAGAPAAVHAAADARLAIPMMPGMRSLNVAVASAMVLGEALRQTSAWPGRLPVAS
ncbi:MAG: tRNA methyltransferase [Alphaproteobacteria bacterium]|nr:tRNA methyltransferase [Alphaproteobacteria bacterium]